MRRPVKGRRPGAVLCPLVGVAEQAWSDVLFSLVQADQAQRLREPYCGFSRGKSMTSSTDSTSVRPAPSFLARWWKSIAVLLLLVFIAWMVFGRGSSLFPRPMPPVTVTYRDSLVGAGIVIQIRNDSLHHLYNVKVVGRNLKQQSSASVKATDHLSPEESVEVGWLEFTRWVPRPGETIEVYCDDYPLPFVSVIPSPTWSTP